MLTVTKEYKIITSFMKMAVIFFLFLPELLNLSSLNIDILFEVFFSEAKSEVIFLCVFVFTHHISCAYIIHLAMINISLCIEISFVLEALKGLNIFILILFLNKFIEC